MKFAKTAAFALAVVLGSTAVYGAETVIEEVIVQLGNNQRDCRMFL